MLYKMPLTLVMDIGYPVADIQIPKVCQRQEYWLLAIIKICPVSPKNSL